MKKRLLALFVLAFSGSGFAIAADLSKGQTLYLPIYSKIWHGDRVVYGKYPIDNLLSALISIRNTSLNTSITVTSARYYSSEGKLIKEYLIKPVVIGAMATSELFLERKEAEGGSGANFVIQWDSTTPTNPPIVEAVHADIRNGIKTLVFITTAQPIQADK